MFILFIHRSPCLCFCLWQNIWTSEQKDKSTEVWWLSYNHLHSQLRTTFTLWLYTRKRTVGDDHICKLECKEIKIPYNIIDSFFNLLFRRVDERWKMLVPITGAWRRELLTRTKIYLDNWLSKRWTSKIPASIFYPWTI